MGAVGDDGADELAAGPVILQNARVVVAADIKVAVRPEGEAGCPAESPAGGEHTQRSPTRRVEALDLIAIEAPDVQFAVRSLEYVARCVQSRRGQAGEKRSSGGVVDLNIGSA